MSDLFSTSGASISECGRYRYHLWREWDAELPIMVWIMLNPSTADAEEDDPTIRKCIGFARRNRCGCISVVNLFAYRATDPKELKHVSDPVGPENDWHILHACAQPHVNSLVAAWGVSDITTARATYVKSLLSDRLLMCFRKNDAGRPGHPLYIPYESKLVAL